MSQAKIIFQRPAEIDFSSAMPTALRIGAPSRREPLPFVPDIQPVMITAVKIPFLSLVWQLMKLALAAIPAILVLAIGLWGCLVLYTMIEPDLARLLATGSWGPLEGKTP